MIRSIENKCLHSQNFIKYSTNKKSTTGGVCTLPCIIRVRFNETDKGLVRNTVDCRTFTLELIKHAKAVWLDGHSGIPSSPCFDFSPPLPMFAFNRRAYYRHFVHDHKKADIDFTTDTENDSVEFLKNQFLLSRFMAFSGSHFHSRCYDQQNFSHKNKMFSFQRSSFTQIY